MKTILLIPAVFVIENVAASAVTLSIGPALLLPSFTKSLLWDAKTLPPDRDTYGIFLAADLNHDQRLDLAIVQGDYPHQSGGNFELGIYLQNPDGTLTSKASYMINISDTWVLDGADFNEDGRLDLLVDDADNDLLLLLGNGDGTFQDPKYLGLNAPLWPVIADLNGDKHLDLLSGGAADGEVYWFTGKGDGTFNPPIGLHTYLFTQSLGGPGAGQIMVADVNRDGELDVVVASPQDGGPIWTGNLDVSLGNGDGTFQLPISTPNVATLRGVLGDFNGDGIADYAGDRLSQQVEIWLGTGDGHFVKGRSYSLSVPAGKILTGDINGDGILDLVLTGETAPGVYAAQLSLLLGKGDGTFQSAQSYLPQPGTIAGVHALKLVDFNGDSFHDLITSTYKPNASKNIGFVLGLNPGPKSDPKRGFLINVRSSAAAPVALETSPDLVNWTVLATNASPAATWPVVDTAAGLMQRFYRAKQP